ncbi:MAG: class I tRNA ligase family protein, partial [Nanoarchaeota archaeon]
DVEYVEIETKGERWIVGRPIIERLRDQNYVIREIGMIKGSVFVGKKVEVFGGRKVLILPAYFLDPEFGTGIVHSVPSDSADDLIALYDLQKDEKTLKKYYLDINEVRSIQPIPVLNTQGIEGIPAEYFLQKYNVHAQDERKKLEEIKKELYKLSFYSSTFNFLYKKTFSKDLEGVKVGEGKEFIRKELIKKGIAEIYYQLSGKVICRCLTPSVVKIVADQWFIDYGNENWKALTHKCLNQVMLYPEKSRDQFNYVIDWLKPWACTHEEGIGTRLPWDRKWLIESLSDSTIYMAYYTIAHLIKDIPLDTIDDVFFDYLFLDKGKKPAIQNIEKLKEEFSYWYPVDFRNSGKDLIQNHLVFFLFNHAAIFPEKYWPKSIGVNGWTMVNGQKMSKSSGNFITIRDAVKKYSADASRFAMLNGGEDLDDPNFDVGFAEIIREKLFTLLQFAKEHYNTGNKERRAIDNWMDAEIMRIINEATSFMDATLFRSALQKIYFDLQKSLKWYLRRNPNPYREVLNRVIETQALLLAPYTPHLCEEIWQSLGKKTLISSEQWPAIKKVKEYSGNEEVIKNTLNDIRNVLQLVKIQPKMAYLYVIPPEKELFDEAKDFFSREFKIDFIIYANNDKNLYDPKYKAPRAMKGKPTIYLE